MPTVGSLFSGIGGLELGLERAGWDIVWQSEIDPYASRVLARHWPDTPNLGDIRDIDWQTVDRVDLVCGGYPCQPFSLAGVRRGDTDPRHLWPHFADALRHLRPRWALLENVPGHLSLGFGRVLGDLAALGYDAEWTCIPAAAVGAPHLRYRVFVVAHAHSEGEPGEPVDALTRSGVMVPDADGEPGQPARRDVARGRTVVEAIAGQPQPGSTGGTPRTTGAERHATRSTDAGAGAVPDAVSDELRQQPVGVAGRSCPAVARHDGENGHVADTEVVTVGPGLRPRRREGSGGDDLATAVARASWPTPKASMTDMHTMESQRPSGTERARMRDNGTPFQTEATGQLNPTWVEWLMGFPPGWTDLEPSATPSSPRSPS